LGHRFRAGKPIIIEGGGMKFRSYLKAALTFALPIVLYAVTFRRYVWLPSYLKVASATTVNIVLNALTLGRYVWLEGRVRGGVFKNWAGRFRYGPQRIVRPTTEEEIVELVKSSRSLRVFGSGHSFNSGVVSDETLVSLDDYSGLVCKYPDKNQIAVRGGTRVRDVVDLLFDDGLAFRALPSHDAQSMAGILSTDVHGTGRIFGTEEERWGFVSQSIVRLRLVDGKGDIHECEPSDDLFKAAVGGIGAVGIITEVVVQGVPRFNVEQKVEMRSKSYVKGHLDQLLRANHHFSLYLFPFMDECQVNTWNRKEKDRTIVGRLLESIELSNGRLQEFVNISIDALAAAWIGNFVAYTGGLPRSGRTYGGIRRGSDLLLESNKGFNRTIYHLHQELEFTVPFEDTFEECERFIELYQKLYKDLNWEEPYHSGLPYALFEVRFTPEHDRTLIGAGRGRRSAWIDLVCNDSLGFEKFYAEAEKLVKEIGARPHLGKFCENFTKADMAKLHGEAFTTFLDLVEEHDPDGKFANGFTRRLFGHSV
jgi:FAD/FMN-containing dehydrogenase